MSERLPVLFVGHGSPMNIISDNQYTRAWRQLGLELTKPKAILVISAHWITASPQLTANHPQKQIYDFGGFPPELYEIKYSVPGAPQIAEEIARSIDAQTTQAWGMDHGSWSVLYHLFPKADVPVIQLSLSSHFNQKQHFDLGKKLRNLRDQQVLIIGSGDIVHNLREIKWDPESAAATWAQDFDEQVCQAIQKRDLQSLFNFDSELFRKSHPSFEHYLPLLYCLGASDEKDQISFPIRGIQNHSISMTVVKFA